MFNLDRFRKAQDAPHAGFAVALRELQTGRKAGHWIGCSGLRLLHLDRSVSEPAEPLTPASRTLASRRPLPARAPTPRYSRMRVPRPARPLTLTLSPSGGEGIETAPSPSARERVGVRVAPVFTHGPG